MLVLGGEKTFSRIDKSGDGRLTLLEVMVNFERHPGYNVVKELQIRAMFAAADQNGQNVNLIPVLRRFFQLLLIC